MEKEDVLATLNATDLAPYLGAITAEELGDLIFS